MCDAQKRALSFKIHIRFSYKSKSFKSTNCRRDLLPISFNQQDLCLSRLCRSTNLPTASGQALLRPFFTINTVPVTLNVAFLCQYPRNTHRTTVGGMTLGLTSMAAPTRNNGLLLVPASSCKQAAFPTGRIYSAATCSTRDMRHKHIHATMGTPTRGKAMVPHSKVWQAQPWHRELLQHSTQHAFRCLS